MCHKLRRTLIAYRRGKQGSEYNLAKNCKSTRRQQQRNFTGVVRSNGLCLSVSGLLLPPLTPAAGCWWSGWMTGGCPYHREGDRPLLVRGDQARLQPRGPGPVRADTYLGRDRPGVGADRRARLAAESELDPVPRALESDRLGARPDRPAGADRS